MAELITTNIPKRALAIDEQGSNLTYIGIAMLGSLTSDAVWQILKIEKVGSETTFEYADGNDNYDNVWDDHLSLTYSL
jgi:hypothetical protein